MTELRIVRGSPDEAELAALLAALTATTTGPATGSTQQPAPPPARVRRRDAPFAAATAWVHGQEQQRCAG